MTSDQFRTELPWPEKGDRLFRADGSYEKTAFIGPNPWAWMLMAEGYLRSAELAVEHCGHCDRNLIVYPIVFQIRHAVELAMKQAVGLAQHLFDEPVMVPRHHRLLDLWRIARPLIERRWPAGGPDDIGAVESMIRELHTADQNAENFRYPIGKRGQRHLQKHQLIDLEHVVMSARKVINFLSGCSDGLADALDYKRDAQLDAQY